MKAGSTDYRAIDEHLFARFVASSPINACDQEVVGMRTF